MLTFEIVDTKLAWGRPVKREVLQMFWEGDAEITSDSSETC
jgi:hypothetical protein